MPTIAELKGIAQEAMQVARSSTDPFEVSRAEDIAEQAIATAERMKGQQISSEIRENRVQSGIESVTAPGTTARSALNLGADILGGGIKGAAGILSLPYELPALLAAGVESGAEKLGIDYDTPDWLRQGRFYEFLAGEWGTREAQSDLGMALENITEAGVETLPALAAGPAVYGMAVTAELTRKQLADSVRQYGKPGQYTAMALEAVPIGGPEFAAIKRPIPGLDGDKFTPETLTASTSKERVRVAKQIEKQQRDQLGPTGREELATAENFGFELTLGQATGNKAQLALENVLRGGEGGGVIVDLDVRNANKVPRFIMKAYDLVDTPTLNPDALQNALTRNYEVYKKGREADFKAQTRAKFDALPDNVTFDVSPILPKIDQLIDAYKLDEPTIDGQPRPLVRALERLKKSFQETTTTKVPEFYKDNRGIRKRRMVDAEIVSGNIRMLTPAELQRHLQDIGQMAFTGSNPKFADVAPGDVRAVARELGQSFKNIINEASSQGDEAARALQEARTFYAQQLSDMKTWGEIPFIKFMDKPVASMNTREIVDMIKKVGDKDMPIVRNLLENERPSSIKVIRKSLLEDIFQKNQKIETRGSGIEADVTVDVRGVLKDLTDLQNNNEFFKGKASEAPINEIKSIMPLIERTLTQQGIKAVVDKPMITTLARMNSEIQGVLFGTPGRYTAQVGERVAETTVRILSDPKGLASAAVTPKLTPILRKALKRQKMSKDELKKLNAWAQAYRLQLAADVTEEGRRQEEQYRLQ